MAIPANFEKFKVFEYNASSNELANKLVDERAFYSYYPHAVQFQELEPSMRKLASNNYPTIIKGNSLMNIFEQQAKIVNTVKDYIRWKLFFEASDLRATVISIEEPEDGCLGVNGSTFEMGINADVYGPNDVVILEGLVEIPLICKSEPRQKGIETIYDWAILEGTGHIDTSWIAPGMQIKAQIGSLRGEGNVTRGNVHWTSGNSFIEFQVPMTSMAWEMKVTNKAWLAAKHYAIRPNIKQFIDMTGGSDITFSEFDTKFKEVTDKQLDLWLAYGRSSGKYAGRHLDGVTEKALTTGPGWYQYMESANYLERNQHQNVIEFFRNFIPPTWNDRVPIEDQVLDVYTGRGGLVDVQRAGEELDAKGAVLQTAEYNYTTEKAFFNGRKAVALGAKQYRAFYIEPFGLVRFHHLPMLDSTTMDTRKLNGLPLQSYEYLIMNDGRGDGREDNIYVLRNEEESQYLYSTGLWTPTGAAAKNGNAQKYHNGMGNENAYKIIREETVGMVVKDPGYFTWVRLARK